MSKQRPAQALRWLGGQGDQGNTKRLVTLPDLPAFSGLTISKRCATHCSKQEQTKSKRCATHCVCLLGVGVCGRQILSNAFALLLEMA